MNMSPQVIATAKTLMGLINARDEPELKSPTEEQLKSALNAFNEACRPLRDFPAMTFDDLANVEKITIVRAFATSDGRKKAKVFS